MKKTISSFFILFLTLPTGIKAQILSTSNKPSQVYTKAGSPGIPTGTTVYGVFAGRTPCKEFMKELNLEVSTDCAKRKMGITFYQDSVTHQPTIYETRGMGKWSGKGRWYIIKGTPPDPQATVFRLDFDANTSLFLLKGDDNVLFILDKNKNFLIGNADFSYTFNRVRR